MISTKDRAILRELAKKQLELSLLPKMAEREKLWRLHNSLKGTRPMVLMEEITFWSEICPDLKCEDNFAREIEENLYKNIVPTELFDDDKVVPSYFPLYFNLNFDRYGIRQIKHFAQDKIGFHIEPAIEIIEDDFCKLKQTEYSFDKKALGEKVQKTAELIGDILPVKPVNTTNHWDISITQQIVNLMGTENMFCSMLQEPEEFEKLIEFVTDENIRLLRFQEENNILQLNNGNDYLGSGSYCFNDELPQKDFDGRVRSIHTWGHINSQESVGISKDMYTSLVLPSMQKIAKEFAAIYYGCCEPVSDFWQDGIEKIDNIRKISISPWCNEKFMADALKGRKTIYSRKPSPNYIGIEKNFDEKAYRDYIKQTVSTTKNKCKTEFICRDIYTLSGNLSKVKLAVDIIRQESENY